MICKFFIFRKEKLKKMNNQVISFIPSNGIGEIYLDVSNMYWYYYEYSLFNIGKEIPFMKFLIDLPSLCMRYYTRLNGIPIGMPQVIKKIGHESAKLIKSFIKIKHVSEDMFYTGDIVTIDYCMEVSRQFLNNEPFDFFIAAKSEIRDTLQEIDRELLNFLQIFEKLFRLFYSLLPKTSKLRENLYNTEKMFKEDLMKQFAKFIIKDTEYSSELYTELKGVFLQRMYLIKICFHIKKKFFFALNIFLRNFC